MGRKKQNRLCSQMMRFSTRRSKSQQKPLLELVSHCSNVAGHKVDAHDTLKRSEVPTLTLPGPENYPGPSTPSSTGSGTAEQEITDPRGRTSRLRQRSRGRTGRGGGWGEHRPSDSRRRNTQSPQANTPKSTEINSKQVTGINVKGKL